jgi:hypothetical protein
MHTYTSLNQTHIKYRYNNFNTEHEAFRKRKYFCTAKPVNNMGNNVRTLKLYEDKALNRSKA